MSGFLPLYPKYNNSVYGFNYDCVLIIYIQNRIILCDLGKELKKIEANKNLMASNIIELVTSIFQLSITSLIIHKIEPNGFLERLIFHRNNSNIYGKTEFVSLRLWSDLATHYLGYYGSYNYNKINILKRNSGQVFAESNFTEQYKPLYINKESICTINLRANFTHEHLRKALAEYRYGYLAHNVEHELDKRKITKIIFHFIEKVKLYADYHSTSSFLSSDTAIENEITIISRRSTKQPHYKIYRTARAEDILILMLIFYLIGYEGHLDIEPAGKWFHEFREHIVRNKENLQIYSNTQIFINLYQETGDQPRYVNKTMCLRYMKTIFHNDKGRYDFGIIAPQSVINESKIDKTSDSIKLANEILDLLREEKYSKIAAPGYVNRKTKLNYRCVFIY